MNTYENLKSLAKTGVLAFLFTANTTDALATTVNPDFEEINKIETPVMNDLLEEQTEEIADTLKPKKKYEAKVVVLKQDITHLNKELEQKNKEYYEQREEFKKRIDQDTDTITVLIGKRKTLLAEIKLINKQIDTLMAKEELVRKDYGEAKAILDKASASVGKKSLDKTKIEKTKLVYDQKGKEGTILSNEIANKREQRNLLVKESEDIYDRIGLVREEIKKEQDEESRDIEQDKNEINALQQKVNDKEAELISLQDIIDNYAQKKKELSKSKK